VKAHRPIPAIEIEFGLRRTGREQAPTDLSVGAIREAMRTGVQPLADRVREEAGHVFAQATSWRQLEAGLAELGYRIERAERGVLGGNRAGGATRTAAGRTRPAQLVAVRRVSLLLSGPP
jgi:hypothetical protein